MALGENQEDRRTFRSLRKMADVVVQYPIEALEGPVLQERLDGG